MLTAFGAWLTYPSCLCLCLAVLLRSAPSLRDADQRGLWLAVTTAGMAMTLDLPAVTHFVMGLVGTDHIVDLMKNLIGVVSAGAVLYFVSAPSGSRRLRIGLCVAIGAILATLLLVDLSAPPHPTHTITAAGGPLPSFGYWLILIATHVVANIICVIVCCWYGLRTDDRPLAAALWLFATGTALAALFWIGRLLRLALDVTWTLPYLPLLINLHALFRAAAILVPLAVSARGALADARTVWRLWPLWRELAGAVPHVVLTTRRTRLVELLWPPVPHRVLAYRKVIEIRDAMLELEHYVPPGIPPLARDHVSALGLTPARADATVLACVVKEARHAKLAGRPWRQSPEESFTQREPGQDHATTLTAEKTHLIELAQAYTSAPVRSFIPRPSNCGG
ncbi:MAB_1171c family putative transporter [Streptomyces sp. NPDC049837]|uniref:MAB_1171c family putative transporter n=1 Tax=Streptomyces sp. NPDC049837 TaxID=3155277 RepID=UPI003439EE91